MYICACVWRGCGWRAVLHSSSKGSPVDCQTPMCIIQFSVFCLRRLCVYKMWQLEIAPEALFVGLSRWQRCFEMETQRGIDKKGILKTRRGFYSISTLSCFCSVTFLQAELNYNRSNGSKQQKHILCLLLILEDTCLSLTLLSACFALLGLLTAPFLSIFLFFLNAAFMTQSQIVTNKTKHCSPLTGVFPDIERHVIIITLLNYL